mgnify:CR=1 FL=1
MPVSCVESLVSSFEFLICDRENEGFDPVPVDFVLNQDDISLMVSENGLASGVRQLVVDAPGVADLYGQVAGFYLDYPGSPVRPGCVYRRYAAGARVCSRPTATACARSSRSSARVHLILVARRQAITIVGIPRAVMTLVRGMFIPQAIVDSATAVNRSVSRSLLIQVVLLLITGLAGPLAAIFFLLAIPSRPVELVNFLSSLFFSFLYPFGVIGMTLLYENLRFGAAWRSEPETTGEAVGVEV